MGCDCKTGITRTVHALAYTIPAGGGRFRIALPPDEAVERYTVLIKDRDTVSPADPVNAFFAIQPMGNMLPNLNAGQGDYLTPGQTYKGTLPGDTKDLTLDIAGLKQDFITQAGCVVHVTIKACGGGRNIPPEACK